MSRVKTKSRLFGKHLHQLNFKQRATIDTSQFTRLIPVKAYGRQPSRESQKGLFHDEDYNFYTKISPVSLVKTQQLVKPYTMMRTFESKELNCSIKIQVTLSVLHSKLMSTIETGILSALAAMHEAGGFDNYILRTPPEELRSALGDRLRMLMHYYAKRPEVKQWGLPARVLLSNEAQQDPWYARHMYNTKKAMHDKHLARHCRKMSPYYLPSKKYIIGLQQPVPKFTQSLNLWWNESPELEKAFRRRLGKAKSFEAVSIDLDNPETSYLKGRGRGGGGKHGRTRPHQNPTYQSDNIDK